MDPSVEAGMDARTDGGGSQVEDGRRPRLPAASPRGATKAPRRPAPLAGQGMGARPLGRGRAASLAGGGGAPLAGAVGGAAAPAGE